MLQAKYKADSVIEVGIDEAGRGCLWGPLIAGAVIWPPEATWTDEIRSVSEQIKDSKKLSAKKRAAILKGIKSFAISYSVGIIEANEIDELGISAANRLAFQRALNGLSVKPGRILLDGILRMDTTIEQIVEPEADGRYLAVAAASILAKETHDDIVMKLCAEEPALITQYAIDSCTGYGTLKHRNGIKTHGKHPLHRNLFLRKLLGDNCLIRD
jgi:ribonuclease HII